MTSMTPLLFFALVFVLACAVVGWYGMKAGEKGESAFLFTAASWIGMISYFFLCFGLVEFLGGTPLEVLARVVVLIGLALLACILGAELSSRHNRRRRCCSQ